LCGPFKAAQIHERIDSDDAMGDRRCLRVLCRAFVGHARLIAGGRRPVNHYALFRDAGHSAAKPGGLIPTVELKDVCNAGNF
jgi:hypothetical protein